ncbi:hypothetical protein X737_23180 [Mesorhizobium sp. L48C026A00]|nr:hypothetical protein X737_23180 [Mesorhizobium sp. L48C026A00]
MLFLLSQISNAVEGTLSAKLPISPLEGEMAGRPEGGERRHRVVSHP